MSTSLFRATGLASGIDTQSMITALVSIERRPIDQLQANQSAYQQQISYLGNIASKLSALSTAATELKDNGVRGATISSSNSSFSASAGTGALAGQWSLQVTQLAVAAKARSGAFASSLDPVDTGSLTLSIDGADTIITKAAGDTLADIVGKINQSGAAVSASVLFDGTSSYLSVSRTETGHSIGALAGTALSISETNDGTGAAALGLSIIQAAKNATFALDGLGFERRSNTVTDALAGIDLNLKSVSAAEDLVVAYDTDATAARLQTFVDAYNEVYGLVSTELSVSSDTNRAATLAGDSSLRSLQRSLHGLISQDVAGLGDVRALVDLGIRSDKDGVLSLDSATLKSAISKDPSAVDRLFSESTVGLGDITSALTNNYVNSVDGILVNRQSGLKDSIKLADDQIARLELRVDGFETNLIRQFTIMEQLVGQMNSMGDYLTNQLNQNNKQS